MRIRCKQWVALRPMMYHNGVGAVACCNLQQQCLQYHIAEVAHVLVLAACML